MSEKMNNSDKIVLNWLESADKNQKTMHNLMKSQDYSWALFIGHLVIEKTLKALYVKKYQKHAIFSHDLLRIAKKAKLELSEEFEEWLDETRIYKYSTKRE